MHDRPSAAELVEAVREFLETDLIGSLTDARLRFQTLVAANVLSVAGREMQGEEQQLREEWHVLAPVVGSGREPQTLAEWRAEVRTMNERLCAKIRSGEYDQQFTEIAALVGRLVEQKLSVANPRYLGAKG